MADVRTWLRNVLYTISWESVDNNDAEIDEKHALQIIVSQTIVVLGLDQEVFFP